MITPVVQVITGGSGWPAIVAAISGGIVGLAGIGSTIWVATRSIRAESARARLDDKRRTYARYLSACNEMAQARLKLNAHFGRAGNATAEKLAVMFEYSATNTAAFASAAEVQLIAPDEIAKLAYEVVRSPSTRKSDRYLATTPAFTTGLSWPCAPTLASP